MSTIPTNWVSLTALDTLRRSERLSAVAGQRLATGKSVNSATDNAARLSIGDVMTAQRRGIMKAVRNLNDGVSLAQTAEGALSSLTNHLQRMRELAIEAATDTLTDTDRSYLDQEYQAHANEIAATVKNTRWNGYRVFQELSETSFELQAGPYAGDRIKLEIPQIYARGDLVAFTNGDFESNATGATSITGWTVGNSRVMLDGSSQIGGWPTPVDTTKPAPSGGDTVAATSTGTMTTTVVASDNPAGDAKSLRLTSTGITVTGYGIVHGPYIVSNEAVAIEAGSEVSFDWKASGGADAYDVYAYLLNTDNGATVKLLDSTGSSGSASTNWATVSTTVPSAGNYKFVFVSGTFDATGGTAAGAQLFIDNISAPPVAKPTLNTTDIKTISTANQAIAEIDLNIASVDAARASLGASINRITHAGDNLAQYAVNIAHSQSEVIDTRYDQESTELARAQALSSAARFALGVAREQDAMSIQMVKSNDQLIGR